MKLIDIIFESVIDLDEGGRKSMTKNEFISRAEEKHQNEDGSSKYSYNNVDYVNYTSPVMITCPIHGDFPQSPSSHLRGMGCNRCTKDTRRLKLQDFITSSQSNPKHQNPDGSPKYTYDNVNYINSYTDVMVTCPKHGDFPVTPNNHKSGKGCNRCFREGRTKTKEEFVKEAQSMKVHQNPDGSPKYTYDNVHYVNGKKIVMITCPKHGDFPITPQQHLQRVGCPWCSESKGEVIINRILHEKNIKFITFKKYDDCISYKSKYGLNKMCRKLEFDFYLPDQNVLIEFDGDYHFKKVRDNHDYMNQVLNDKEKNQYTKSKGIKLIRISYHDMKNIEEELMKGLDSTEQLYLSTNYPIDKGWRDTTI